MSEQCNLFTIGFTQKKAEQFFETLLKNNIKRIIDTRLNNVSQLAGFTKKQDLEYFLTKIGGIEYLHVLDFAPTKNILDEYKKKLINWTTYESKFNQLIKERQIETIVNLELLNNACLLCSEAKPHYCHRRLVAEYLHNKLERNIKIHHL